MLAGATAGASVRTTSTGAVSAALSLAPKSLATNTIMMAIAHSGGKKEPKGLLGPASNKNS